MTTSTPIIAKAETIARLHMDGYQDVSHDWLHIKRVRDMALKLARGLAGTEQLDLLVVEIAALFHDINDAKYITQSAGDSVQDLHGLIFDTAIAQGELTSEQAALICRICENVSYSKERSLDGQLTTWHKTCYELHCVQDADKLDAMGAIGILRCAAYSAAKHRPLVDADVREGTALHHFADKLLTLVDLLKTEEGRRIGISRHALMINFVQQAALEQGELSSSAMKMP